MGNVGDVFFRIASLSCAVAVVVLLATVAALGASTSSASSAGAPTGHSCEHVCSTSPSFGEVMAGDIGTQPGEGARPCVMSPGCGGGQAHAHGSSGLVGSMAAPFVVVEPAALAAGAAPSSLRLPDRLTLGTESPPPRTS